MTEKLSDCLVRLELNELSRKPAPLDFVLPGLIKSTVGALISPGGMGKSFWVMGLALSMAPENSKNFTGMKLTPGKTVVLSAEDGADVLSHRSAAYRKHMAACESFDNVDYRNCTGLKIDIMEPVWFDLLCEIGKGCRLMILDTLRRFHTMDENSSTDMSKLLTQLEMLAKNTGAAILFIHHANKNAVLTGMGTVAQAARGSSVITDNSRWSAALSEMTAVELKSYNLTQDDAARYVKFTVTKQNYGTPTPPVIFKRGEDGELLPQGIEVKKEPASPAVDKLTKGEGRGTACPVDPEPKHPAVTSKSATGAFNGNW